MSNITVIKHKKKVSLFYMIEKESVRNSPYSISNAVVKRFFDRNLIFSTLESPQSSY